MTPLPPPSREVVLASRLRIWQRLALGALALLVLVAGLAVLALLGLLPGVDLRLGAPETRTASEQGVFAKDGAPLADDATEPVEPREPPPDRAVFTAVDWSALAGWTEDDHAAALAAFRRGCGAITGRPDSRAMGPDGIGGTAADWKPLCAEARTLPSASQEAAEAFFRQRFRPYRITNRETAEGLFTGYYEPSLRGSRRQNGPYQTPLLRRPAELVSVDLGDFRDHLRGERIAGRVEGGRLQPYADRQSIDDGALEGRRLELLWVDDPVDAFFLHIQGSGRVLLDTGGTLRVGYAGQNGHPYYAIGRALIERGEVPREEMSLQAIRSWLEANPQATRELLNLNPSYVFFTLLDGPGPLGAMGIPLTAGRSLAVDRSFLPLGAPMWLDGEIPALVEPVTDTGADTVVDRRAESVEDDMAAAVGEELSASPQPSSAPPSEPFRRLFIAQDTGGAIRGPVRGDVFWGYGDEAEQRAGRMRHSGRLTLLLPATLPPPGAVPRVDPAAPTPETTQSAEVGQP